MDKDNSLVIFLLDNQRYALPILSVQRVVLAAAITVLPGAPDIVSGLIDIAGEIIPVINIRKCFNHPLRNININDHFLIAHTGKRKIALQVDETKGVVNIDANKISPVSDFLPKTKYFVGAVTLEDGLTLINDLEQLLSLDEEREIEVALQNYSSADDDKQVIA